MRIGTRIARVVFIMSFLSSPVGVGYSTVERTDDFQPRCASLLGPALFRSLLVAGRCLLQGGHHELAGGWCLYLPLAHNLPRQNVTPIDTVISAAIRTQGRAL